MPKGKPEDGRRRRAAPAQTPYNRSPAPVVPTVPADLVIQGVDIETSDLKRLAKLSGASGIEQLDARAFRLREGKPAQGVDELCAARELDFAFVPVERRLAEFRLLVMDMDSTLITIETVDELADMVGLKNEVAAI